MTVAIAIPDTAPGVPDACRVASHLYCLKGTSESGGKPGAQFGRM